MYVSNAGTYPYTFCENITASRKLMLRMRNVESNDWLSPGMSSC